jgi:heme-degrading monooxygenase HmoA
MRPLLLALACVLALLPGCAHSPTAAPAGTPRIARVWHGRVPSARADEYARYLEEGARKFRSIPGNLGYQVMRETVGEETHFMVVSYWPSRDAIRAYAGEDILRTRHLPRDAEFLIEPEQTVMNYELTVDDTGR